MSFQTQVVTSISLKDTFGNTFIIGIVYFSEKYLWVSHETSGHCQIRRLIHFQTNNGSLFVGEMSNVRTKDGAF